MAFNHSELRGKMVAKYGSVKEYALAKGRKKDWAYRLLDRNLSDEEILEIAKDFDIASGEIPKYFFSY